jgi:hypothetical protein
MSVLRTRKKLARAIIPVYFFKWFPFPWERTYASVKLIFNQSISFLPRMAIKATMLANYACKVQTIKGSPYEQEAKLIFLFFCAVHLNKWLWYWIFN